LMIEQVGFGRRLKPFELSGDSVAPPAVRSCLKVSNCMDLQGVLLYTPSHFTVVDNAVWAENWMRERRKDPGKCERNPFGSSPSPFSGTGRTFSPALEKMFRERHGLRLNLGDWAVSMARMAIPFARRVVTVIAPDRFTLPRAVFDEAARRSVEVRVVPHSYFPREALRKVALWLSMPAFVDAEGAKFDPIFTRVFGEEPDCNHRLIPIYWRDYAAQSKKPRHA
ncbi:MAG: hypothetical protein ABL994_01680, partial [Verrucomicrobiales bacterium]